MSLFQDVGLDAFCRYVYTYDKPPGCMWWRVVWYDFNWNQIFVGPTVNGPSGMIYIPENYPAGWKKWLVLECMDTGIPDPKAKYKVDLTWKDFMCCTSGNAPSYFRLKNADTNRCIYNAGNNTARQWDCSSPTIQSDKRFDHCVQNLGPIGSNQVRYKNRETGKCLYFDTSSPNYAQIARYKNCANPQTKLRRLPVTSAPPLIAIRTFPAANRQYLYGNPFNRELRKVSQAYSIFEYYGIPKYIKFTCALRGSTSVINEN